MDPQDEQDLIRRIGAGDAKAFRALLDHYYPTLFKMAFHLCGHREDAEDITQMASLKIAQNIASFRGESKFTTWAYTIVLNTFRDWTDSRNNTGKGRVDIVDVEMKLAAPDNPEQAAQTNDKIRMLAALPDAEREAVVLVFGQGFSHKEAANMIGCAESTVSWRVHEARKKLAAMQEGR